MNKVICKGLILKDNGETKCIVPNKPVVIVMPTVGAFLFSDGTYAGDDLQVIECEPDTRWFRTRAEEDDCVVSHVIYHRTAINEYIQEITGVKSEKVQNEDSNTDRMGSVF